MKTENILIDNRIRKNRDKEQFKFLTAFLFLVILILLFKALLFLQSLLISDKVLYYKPTSSSYFIIIIALLLPSFALASLISNPIFNFIKPSRESFLRANTYKLVSKVANNISLYFLPIFFVLPGIFSYVYIVPQGIYYNPLISLKERHYKFKDIKEIVIGSYINHRYDTLNFSYQLVMNDDTKIELYANNESDFILSYPKFIKYFNREKNITKKINFDKSVDNYLKEHPDAYDLPIVKILKNKM